MSTYLPSDLQIGVAGDMFDELNGLMTAPPERTAREYWQYQSGVHNPVNGNTVELGNSVPANVFQNICLDNAPLPPINTDIPDDQSEGEVAHSI